jgi:hypothetical protein
MSAPEHESLLQAARRLWPRYILAWLFPVFFLWWGRAVPWNAVVVIFFICFGIALTTQWHVKRFWHAVFWIFIFPVIIWIIVVVLEGTVIHANQ